MQVSNTTLFFLAHVTEEDKMAMVKRFKVIIPKLTDLTVAPKGCGVVFVNVHAASEDEDENEKDDFYWLLDSTLCEIPRSFVQFILGGINAKIGREECFKPIIETHSLHQLSRFIQSFQKFRNN